MIDEAPKPAQEQVVVSTPRVNVQSTLEETVANVLAARDPRAFDPNMPFVYGTKGNMVFDVERHMPRPRSVRKHVRMTDAASFLDYFKVFKDCYRPRLFGMQSVESGMQVLCIFDYDAPEDEHASRFDARVAPVWNRHTMSLKLSFAEDYARLKAVNNVWMEQEDFALFIEEITHLFVHPTGADMLEMAQTLRGVKTANWKAGQRLSNGERHMEYTETNEAKSLRGEIVVPEYLALRSPMFEGYEPVNYRAAFRWKLDDGQVWFSLRLLTKVAERDAMQKVKDGIVHDTGLPIWNVSTFRSLIVADIEGAEGCDAVGRVRDGL